MLFKIYKSLDKPSSLFGLVGSYLRYAAVGVVIALIPSAIIWKSTNGVVGMIVFIGLSAAVYAVTLTVQAKLSERERTKWFCSHRLPSFIKMTPKRMSKYMTVNFRNERISR